ncbi:MAG: MerR family transcriptional regulator [Actinomycetota bacterium]|nr:MerR family transcriptional regulator [Actinomycetota bacterium]
MAQRRDEPVYVISVAAELAEMHPQTLRAYERSGLVTPRRSAGNVRRYSQRDVERLREVQQLTSEGLNLAGVRMVLELREALATAKRRTALLEQELERLSARLREEVAAAHQSHRFELVPLRRGALEPYGRSSRVREARGN